MEVLRKKSEGDRMGAHYVVPASSKQCVECHQQTTPAIVEHWKGSTHARKAIGCVECHQAEKGDADGFDHYGALIATVVTPLDCRRCHRKEADQFARSHHAAGGNILHSLDNTLAETVEGSRVPFNPHSPTPGRDDLKGPVNGMASALSGCQQCHGTKVALRSTDGKMITFEDLKPDENGKPTNQEAVARIMKDKGRPLLHPSTYPNHGIGRLNLDGSRGSCSACHSRHDFSARRARQPENCGNCHLGPDHPQKEIYEESKHGVAFRDLKDFMNLGSERWVLGKDYSQAPTCATCHMSANTRNGGEITHDPGERISWTNRPPVSLWMDTDENHNVVTETDPVKRAALIKDTGQAKRTRMKSVCSHCHTGDYIDAFYKQYDDFIVLYNEKFAKPGQSIMKALREQQLLTKTEFDEEIEWTWFYLWHHEGRRARHGVSMMAPDYTHWHGMFEVADRFYMKFIPQAREIVHHAESNGMDAQAKAVRNVIDGILNRPEHTWFDKERRPGANGSKGKVR
ncbi:MAG: hydroxylamine oxidoreductase [Planctomycetes bacterium]|nr:hydroxylamine oxidoreductase [Planctomycetota bacterium]